MLELKQFAIPRWLSLHENVKSIEFHVYRDATDLAYGAVCYLRLVHDDDEITTQLVMSNAKVAPLKIMIIPRLELLAAVLCVQIGKTVSSR